MFYICDIILNMSDGLMGGISEGLSILWKLLVFIFVIFIGMQIINVFFPGLNFDKLKTVDLLNSSSYKGVNNFTDESFFGLENIFNSQSNNKKLLAPDLKSVGIDNNEYYKDYNSGYDFKLQNSGDDYNNDNYNNTNNDSYYYNNSLYRSLENNEVIQFYLQK